MSIPVTVMPWHKPDPCLPPKMQTPAAFNPSYLEYMSSLNVESKVLNCPLSSIMCTIGASSNNADTLLNLMDLGMDVALIHMSNVSRDDVEDMIKIVQVCATGNSTVHNRVFPLAIAVQMKKPGVHIGALDRGAAELEAGNELVLTTNLDWKNRGNCKVCYFDLPNAGDLLMIGDKILIDTGVVKLTVTEISGNKIMCNIDAGGPITDNMKVSIPGVPLHLAAVTEQDKDDLEFISRQSSVDIVVVASVKSGNHPKEVKEILKQNDCEGIMVFSRIDTKDGLDNVQEIARESDGIILARNELATEIHEKKLFLAQKIVISTCNKIGKPVYICADYMESMINLPSPAVYCEIMDLQSAILDGADGILLEDTTSDGHFHDEVIKMVSAICIEAEAAVWQNQVFSSLLSLALPPIDPTHSIAISAVDAALKSCAAAIILATTSGYSAHLISRYRPRCHIIAVTRYGQVARQLNAWRAVIPIHYITPPLADWNKEVDLRLQMGIELGKEKGLISKGDPIVLLNGWRHGAGFTNTLRVVYASESDPWVFPHKLPLDYTAMSGLSSIDPTMDRGTSFHMPSFVTVERSMDRSTSYQPDRLSDRISRSNGSPAGFNATYDNVGQLNATYNNAEVLNATYDNAGALNATYDNVTALNGTQNLGNQQLGRGNGNGSLNVPRYSFERQPSLTERGPNGSQNIRPSFGPNETRSVQGSRGENLSSSFNVPAGPNTSQNEAENFNYNFKLLNQPGTVEGSGGENRSSSFNVPAGPNTSQNEAQN